MDIKQLTYLVSSLTNTVENLSVRIQRLEQSAASIQTFKPSDIIEGRAEEVYKAAAHSHYAATVHLGTIILAMPHTQAYQVKLDGISPYVVATPLRFGSTGSLGVSNYSSYMPGTRVLVAMFPDMTHGVILGAQPMLTSILAETVPGRISYRSATVFPSIAVIGSGLVGDWSNRTPFDQLVTGEFGFTSETGIGFHIDPFMVRMGLDDYTGITVSFWDRMTRIGGELFQLWSGFQTADYFKDGNEISYIRRQPFYIWEFCGHLNYNVTPQSATFDKKTLEELMETPDIWTNKIDLPERRTEEEEVFRIKDRLQFNRLIDFGGFLGQGECSFVVAPPPGWEQASLPFNVSLLQKKDSEDRPYPIGLAQIVKDISGFLGFRSAHAICLSKHPLIVPPIEKNPPWAKLEEIEEDFEKFTRKIAEFLGGFPHLDLPSFNTSYGLEYQHYFFNYACMSGIGKHFEDFNFPCEKDYYDQTFGKSKVINPYAYVRNDEFNIYYGNEFFAPTIDEISYDYSRSSMDLYATSSFLMLHPNGSISMTDGWGSEIRLSGGKIYISAPLGIYFYSGRDIISFAGKDIIQRSFGATDIVSNTDIRIASICNLNLAGGLGEGPWGVLIESRYNWAWDLFNDSTQQGISEALEKYPRMPYNAGIIISCPRGPIKQLGERISLLAIGKPIIEEGLSDIPKQFSGQIELITGTPLEYRGRYTYSLGKGIIPLPSDSSDDLSGQIVLRSGIIQEDANCAILLRTGFEKYKFNSTPSSVYAFLDKGALFSSTLISDVRSKSDVETNPNSFKQLFNTELTFGEILDTIKLKESVPYYWWGRIFKFRKCEDYQTEEFQWPGFWWEAFYKFSYIYGDLDEENTDPRENRLDLINRFWSPEVGIFSEPIGQTWSLTCPPLRLYFNETTLNKCYRLARLNVERTYAYPGGGYRTVNVGLSNHQIIDLEDTKLLSYDGSKFGGAAPYAKRPQFPSKEQETVNPIDLRYNEKQIPLAYYLLTLSERSYVDAFNNLFVGCRVDPY